MSKVISGISLGAAICKALGKDPKRVTAISIVCSVGDAARVEVTEYVPIEGIGELKQVFERYKLVEDKE